MNNNDSLLKQPNIFMRFRKSTLFGIVIILVVMCVVLSIAAGDAFLSPDNLISVSRQFSFTAIMAIGEALVIITSGIDLSVGSVFAFSSVVGCMGMVDWGLGSFLGFVLGCLAGLAFGLANGIFVTKLKLPPFIATLGTMSIARGLSYGITGGYPINNLPDDFKMLGGGTIGALPIPILLLAVVAIIFGILLQKSIVGRRIYAIGGNEEAARVSGIHVDRVKLLVFAMSGLLAGVAGLATAARLGVAQSTAGQGYEMDAISAVIIGGASVNGGTGNIGGPILGAAIMGILRNGLVLLSVSAYWQQAVLGIVIIVAVAFDKLRQGNR